MILQIKCIVSLLKDKYTEDMEACKCLGNLFGDTSSGVEILPETFPFKVKHNVH